jgi:acyl carrier protein
MVQFGGRRTRTADGGDEYVTALFQLAAARNKGRDVVSEIARPAPGATGWQTLEFGRPSAFPATMAVNIEQEVLSVLNAVLSLGGRSAGFTRATHLLGALPELDSMAVVTLITTLEDRLGIVIPDDDLNGDTFATVGSLVDYVSSLSND